MNGIAICSLVTASAITLVACASTESPPTVLSETYSSRIPIADFDGFRPYEAPEVKHVDAFVEFGRNGLLKASLGCTLLSARYGFTAHERLRIQSDFVSTTIAEPTRYCTPDILAREQELGDFLQSEPEAPGQTGNDWVLKNRRSTLIMQSVARVFGDTTPTMGGN